MPRGSFWRRGCVARRSADHDNGISSSGGVHFRSRPVSFRGASKILQERATGTVFLQLGEKPRPSCLFTVMRWPSRIRDAAPARSQLGYCLSRRDKKTHTIWCAFAFESW
jgi:hypothetical protein